MTPETKKPDGRTLLHLKAVSVRHGPACARNVASSKPAVDSVDLTIAAGETVGLLGESGCGKTTLARAILGLIPITAGEIIFGGDHRFGPHDAPPRAWKHSLSMVFQDAAGSLNPRRTVAQAIEEPLLRLGGLSAKSRVQRVQATLSDVRLSLLYSTRFPHELSGGERQRVAIARALVNQPKLVICDEPTSALDVSVQAQIVALLADLQRRFGMAYLFISHNVDLVRLACNRVAVMASGRIVEQGLAAEVLFQPSHPATQRLMASTLRVRTGT